MSDELRRGIAVVDSVADIHVRAPESATDRSAVAIAEELTARASVAAAVATTGDEADAVPLVLQLIGRAGCLTADHLAEQMLRDDTESIEQARPRVEAALHRQLLAGYIEKRTLAYQVTDATGAVGVVSAAGHTVVANVYSITAKGAGHYALPPSSQIRSSTLTHHFQTLEAAWRLEREYRIRGYAIVDFKREDQLIAADFRGKTFTRGVELSRTKYPDACLYVRAPDAPAGSPPEAINIEYVSRGYTDKMIREKATAFGGAKVVWVAPTNSPSTIRRLEAITGQEAMKV